MAKVVGLVNLHSNVDLKGLTERRPVASVSFLGRYGIIDFVLSNFSNSQIDNVGILIKEKPRSLFKHLSNGNAWNFNSKRGGVQLLYDEKFANNNMYNHDINNILENIAFIEKNKPDYVVISPAHIITTMDFSEAIKAHRQSGAEISIVYKKIKNANETFIGSDFLKVKDGVVQAIDKNKGNIKNRAISLETYIFNTKALIKLLKEAQKVSTFFDLRDILSYVLDEKKINAYEFKGFAAIIDSFEAYFKVCQSFLNIDVSTKVFKNNWPIFTNTNDTPPTKYLKNADVQNSFVANGAVIDGTVSGCIIGREVSIGKGAVVKNSIIFSGAKVEADAVLENVIVDKDARIKKIKELKGSADEPLYVDIFKPVVNERIG